MLGDERLSWRPSQTCSPPSTYQWLSTLSACPSTATPCSRLRSRNTSESDCCQSRGWSRQMLLRVAQLTALRVRREGDLARAAEAVHAPAHVGSWSRAAISRTATSRLTRSYDGEHLVLLRAPRGDHAAHTRHRMHARKRDRVVPRHRLDVPAGGEGRKEYVTGAIADRLPTWRGASARSTTAGSGGRVADLELRPEPVRERRRAGADRAPAAGVRRALRRRGCDRDGHQGFTPPGGAFFRRLPRRRPGHVRRLAGAPGVAGHRPSSSGCTSYRSTGGAGLARLLLARHSRTPSAQPVTSTLWLETGTRQPEAMELYQSAATGRSRLRPLQGRGRSLAADGQGLD